MLTPISLLLPISSYHFIIHKKTLRTDEACFCQSAYVQDVGTVFF